MNLKHIFGLLILISGAHFSFGQGNLKSTVVGVVRDNVAKKPVEGAVIFLAKSSDSLRAISDAQGRFSFRDVAAGRYIASVHSLVYETDHQEVLVITGKETRIDFLLGEKVFELETLTIESRPTNNAESGSISIPIEKVMRMPANFFDPVRMLTSYPGVVTANDQANNIVVKGNSPTGLLWRLNGMDIVNPNHLANAGTFNDKPAANGGGVNILSAQMLDRTDFISGAMPARYGNLTSAALDMTLRNGNEKRREYTAQASLIGLDFAAEGPLNKRTSFLVNIRLSTVGILSYMGVNFGGESINFQDLSFNLNREIGERGGSLKFFGFGGVSSNKFYSKDSSEWEVDKDRFTILYSNRTYAVGTRLDLPLRKSFTFSSGVTMSSNDQDREADSHGPNWLPMQTSKFDSNRTLVSSFASITGKWSPKISAEAGVMVNVNFDDLSSNERFGSTQTNFGGSATSVLYQPYAQATLRAGNFSTTIGGRYMYWTLGKGSFDPRINLQYQLSPVSNVYLTGGYMSQMLPAAMYLAPINSAATRSFLKKLFVEAGHMVQFENWKLNSSVYYHYYDKVPVSLTNNFSALNYIEGVVTTPLEASGTGTNTGVTIQAERSFVAGYYILGGASLYESTYTGVDAIERPTKFAGRYSLMITGGREWAKIVNENNRSFGIHGRMLYMGGLRDTPINENASQASGTTLYESDTYSVSLRDYVRFDLRVSWRKDKKNYTRTIALDVQNVAGIKNEAYRYYDAFQQRVVTQTQVGFIPVLVYRVDF
jgi:Carboxypeptidase regulatory-like domain